MAKQKRSIHLISSLLFVTFCVTIQIKSGIAYKQQIIPHFDIQKNPHHQQQYEEQQQQFQSNQNEHEPSSHPTFILTENFNILHPTQTTTTLNGNSVYLNDSTFHPIPSDFLSTDIGSIEDGGDAGIFRSPKSKCEFWLVSNEGNLTSFGDHTQSVNCVYRVTPLDPTVCSLELHFDDFDVVDVRSKLKNNSEQKQRIENEFAQLSANSESCIDNYLEFNNRKRYCHEDWKNRIDIVEIDPNYEKDFLFRLVLDRQVHSSGFNIKYKPLFNTCKSKPKKFDKLKDADSILHPVQMSASSPSSYCDERHTEMEFEIKSNNYPKNYSNNLNCVYYIVRKSDDVCGLELKFVHFDIEESEGCAYDFFEIDGENFCGGLSNGSRNIFKFDTAVKSISFQTDSQVNAPGFHIKLKQIKDCTNSFMPVDIGNQSRIQKCNIVWHECEGQLSSLKYPELYPNNLLCAYTIERNPKGRFCGIRIDFINFDLQNSKDCSSDFFEIENKRYCGHSLRNSQKNIPFNHDGYIRFLFKSDAYESRPGFLLNYTQIPCKDDQNIMNLAESKLPIDMDQEKMINVQKQCIKIFQEKKFELISDTVDEHYKDNQNCRFTIKKYSSKVCYLEMNFKMFDLEASADCQYDYMEVGSAVRLCGTLNQETSRIYMFDKPEMIITFHTDATNERKGYLIQTEQLECQGDRIIREHDIPEDSKEGLQSLEQYKFEQQHHYIQPNDTQIVLKKQENFVHPTSEFDSSIPKRKYALLGNTICSKAYQQKEFFIHSPGFPGNYQTDLDCLYMIIPYSPDVCRIEINFDSFELQPYDFEKNCLKSDFVDFDNKEQFCGKMTETQTRIYPMLPNETFFIHFHSDSFRTSFDKGFRFYVRQMKCSYQSTKAISYNTQQNHCSRIFMSSSFDIQSPLYPLPYPSNSYCDYRIVKFKSPGMNICFLEIHFVEFDLQTSTNCNKDYVSFNGIKLCGSVAKDSIRLFPFYDNEFTVSFYSDSSISSRGFYLKVRQNECPLTPVADDDSNKQSKSSPDEDMYSNYQIYHTNQICQQTFSSTYFEFESPNYPKYYLPGLSCVFTIQRRHSRYCKLELFFVDFDVEPSTRCIVDYLLIDNVKYCNSNRPNSVLQIPFYEPEKRIYFRSVYFRPRKGFMIQARQVDCDTFISEPKHYLNKDIKSSPSSASNQYPDNKLILLPSLPSICEICVTEVTGHIQSYDYPNYYPPNVNCTYRITPLPDNCMVQLRFEEFDFDYSPECNQDYLEINGIRYCGHQLKDVSMLLLNKRKDDLTVRMVTSSRGAMIKPSFKGFRASYTQLSCLDAHKTDHPANQIPQIQPATKSVSIDSPKNYDHKMSKHKPTKQIMHTTFITTTPVSIYNEAIYCDQTFDDKIFEIRSPGYPYRYFDDLECSYLIRKNSANVCRLKVTFNYFNLIGEDGNCRGDYLDVFNTRFCGVLDRYTIKEVPFLQEKLLLHFHTNNQQTANGFYLTLEQVDCIAAQPISTKKSEVPKEQSQVSKTNPQKTESSNFRSSINRQQIHHNENKDLFKYDDDEIISEFDTRNKATVEAKSHVIYEDDNQNMNPNQRNESPIKKFNNSPQYDMQKSGNNYPLRYYSRNITVIDESDQESIQMMKPMNSIQSATTQHPHISNQEKPEVYEVTGTEMEQQYSTEQPMTTTKLCDQSFIEKVYFELKVSDLKMSKKGASCQLHIKKVKSYICQLDVMFIRYNLNDTTCSQQYLSIDGERICGYVHESTVKRFWFMKPELYLFVKLNQIGSITDEIFEIKARQVECAANIDIHQLQEPSYRMQAYPTTKPNDRDYQYSAKGQSERRYRPDSDLIHPQQLGKTNRNLKSEWQTYTLKLFKDKDHPSIKDTVQESQEPEKFNRYCDLIENEMHFKIVSPGDSDISRCRYTIRKANDNVCAIDIKFDVFRLNEAMKCDREFIEIDSTRICGAFPIGHERRYHFLPNEYEKIIYYTSSKSLKIQGDFKLDVKQIEDCDKPFTEKLSLTMPTVCDISVRNYRGNIKSPNYPALYGDYTKCVYRIQAIGEDYCTVKLKIRDIDIEIDTQGRTKCNKDWLEVGEQKICGNKLNQTEYTIPFEKHNGHKVVQIKFTSDAVGNGRGFDIEYRQELCVRKSVKSNLISSEQKGLSIDNRFRLQIKPVKNDYPSLSSSMSPHYPPNYVSKAHMHKTMDRKEFIKMMLMTKEKKEKIKMNINQKEDSKIATTMSSINVSLSETEDSMTTTSNIPANTIVFTTIPTMINDTTDSNIITTEAPVTSDLSM